MEDRPPFQPVRFYDLADVAVSQVLDDEVTLRSVRELLFSPERLSPAERSQMDDLLTDRMGGSPIARAVAGVLTNPFTYLIFVTSPAGAEALRAGRAIFSYEGKFSLFVRDNLSSLDHLRLSTAQQALRDSPAGPAIRDIHEIIRSRGLARQETLQSLVRVMDQLGVDSLDPRDVPRHLREEVERIRQALFIKKARWDETVEEMVPRVKRRYYVRGQEVSEKEFLKEVMERQEELSKLQDDLDDLANQEMEAKRLDNRAMLKEIYEQRDALLEERKSILGSLSAEVEDVVRDPRTTRAGSTVERRAIVRGAWKEQVDEVVERYGLDEVVEEFERYERESLLRMFGRRDLPEELRERFLSGELIGNLDELEKVFDEQQIFKWLHGTENMQTRGLTTAARLQRAGEMLRGEKGDSYWSALIDEFTLRGTKDPEHLARMYRRAMGATLQRGYVPRNLLEKVVEPSVRQATKVRTEPVRSLPQLATYSLLPRSKFESQVLWHPEDLARMREVWDLPPVEEGLVPELDALERRSERAYLNAIQQKGMSPYFARIDFVRGHDLYHHTLHRTEALYTARLSDATIAAQRDALAEAIVDERAGVAALADSERVAANLRTHTKAVRGSVFEDVPRELQPGFGSDDPLLAYSNVDVLEQTMELAPEGIQKEMVNTWLPAVEGTIQRPDLPGLVQSHFFVKRTVKAFTESPLASVIARSGEAGRKAIARMEEWADDLTDIDMTGRYEEGVAKWLYVTHLGLNAASMLLNLTQPLLLVAPILGVEPTLRAYGTAIKELGGYLEDRVRTYGLRPLSSAEKHALVRKHFRYANFEGRDLLGFGEDFAETIDQVVFGGRKFSVRSGDKGLFRNIGEYMMAGFEKTEWLVRSVAAHSVENAYRAAGLRPAGGRFVNDVRRFLEETQFGQGPTNTPTAFLDAPVLSSPIMKMFMTFPLRSLTAVFSVLPEVDPSGSRMKATFNLVGRGIAISAITYELGKGLLGVDLSRGLFVNATFDVLGTDRIVESEGLPVPVPPVIDIPLGIIRGLAGDDLQLVGRSLSRMVPGGVSAFRLAKILPSAGGSLDQLRGTYADWQHPAEDGRIPVYRGDGSFVGLYSPNTLVLKGLGADLSRFQTESELDHFLAKNRDEATAMKREYLKAVLNKQHGKAARVKAAYEKKFGVPMAISHQQVVAFIRNQETSRTERILDRLPREIRPQLTEVAEQSRTLTVPTLQGGETARQRDPQREFELPPEVKARLLQEAQQGFASF